MKGYILVMKKRKQRIQKFNSRKFGLGIVSLTLSMFYLTTTTVVAYENGLGFGENSLGNLSLYTYNSDGIQGLKATASQADKAVSEFDVSKNKATQSEAVFDVFYDADADIAANRRFEEPNSDANTEELYDILDKTPDDYQNNDYTYMKNMDDVGDGFHLEDGEIREINSFGGWTAIDKDGKPGRFAIGKKNDRGYFTGWRRNEDGTIVQGGMLGSDALDRIYVHEQALDRTFNYMLMLAKGRTRANREDKVQDGTKYNPKTENNEANKKYLSSLPVNERDDILMHAPNVEGFNGIEKHFAAYSTKYGSRLKLDFITGYISDYEGSKGSYRVVIKATKEDDTVETVYDHTINSIDGIVENEVLYSEGLDLKAVNRDIKNLLKKAYTKKKTVLANERLKEDPTVGILTPAQKKARLEELKEVVAAELVARGEDRLELLVDEASLTEKNLKKNIPSLDSYATIANTLNNTIKVMFSKGGSSNERRNASPIWLTLAEKDLEGNVKSKDPERVYKLLNFVLPTAKKIIYHGDTDQVELVTDSEKVATVRAELEAKLREKEAQLEASTDDSARTKLNKEISALKSGIKSTNAYTYIEARNGEKELKILGSHMEAKTGPSTSGMSESEYNRYHTNELAAEMKDGLAKFTGYFVDKDNVVRSNELSDADLSEKIEEGLDGDKSKLGRGGRFQTGDIKLDKDVVSYTVQIIPENQKRVGVNFQSPRIQYNEPILADFSILQDTLEPSKYVVRRILKNLNDDPKFPKDKLKKIEEEMDKPGISTTSKLKELLVQNALGNVKVRYVDKEENMLSDGYIDVATNANLASEYNYTLPEDKKVIVKNNKIYKLTEDNGGLREGSAPSTGRVFNGETIITYLYEEAPARAAVRIMQEVDGVETELLTHRVNLSGKPGETMSEDEVNKKIEELKKLGYKIKNNKFKAEVFDLDYEGDDQDPTQVYEIVVERDPDIIEVTEPKVPDTPVDPKKPDGPKYPVGLEEKDLRKELTRTINYVKKETNDGEEIPNARPSVEQKVDFKRSALLNLKDNSITYRDWTSTSGFPSVKTPVLEGYLADKKEIAALETISSAVVGDKQNISEKVVYTKIGAYSFKIPNQNNKTVIPYPNDPDDATKIGKGGGPIPYVDGYVPKIGNTPLKLIDPKDPKKGYVPPTPNTPDENIEIVYVGESRQRALVKIVLINDKGEEVKLLDSVTIDGVTGEDIDVSDVVSKVKALIGQSDDDEMDYHMVSNPLAKGAKFDGENDVAGQDPSQVFVISLGVINVIPPIPEIVERPIIDNKKIPGEDTGEKIVTVEVKVPEKDADRLVVNYTKKGSTEIETIVSIKGKNGKWSLKKAPDGVTINPSTGLVSIPAQKIEPDTKVDTKTKNGRSKFSKIVSVIPKIKYSEDTSITTSWINRSNGEKLQADRNGVHEKGKIEEYNWVESRLSGDKLVHTFKKASEPDIIPDIPSPDGPKPSVKPEDKPKSEDKPRPTEPSSGGSSPRNSSSNTSIPSNSVPSNPVPSIPIASPVLEVAPVETPETKENPVNSNRILKKKDIQSLIPKTGDKGMDAMIKLSIVSILSVFGLLVLKFKKKETEEK